jgi:hypothetical protein
VETSADRRIDPEIDRPAEDYVRRLVDAAPPFSAEQRDRLAVILWGAVSGCDAVASLGGLTHEVPAQRGQREARAVESAAPHWTPNVLLPDIPALATVESATPC